MTLVYRVFDDLDIPLEKRADLYSVATKVVGDDFDSNNVRETVEFNYRKMSKAV